jgi:hypothetical protein
VRRALTLGALALVACGPPPCPEVATEADTAPVLTEFDVFSQLADDPWTVVFVISFEDSDGDVGVGAAEFFLNGNTSATAVPMFDLFRQSSLPVDATSGRIAIPLRFREDVQDGAGVKIGVQVVDGAASRSNCYSLDLSFAVEPVASRRVPCEGLTFEGAPDQSPPARVLTPRAHMTHTRPNHG